MASLTGNLVAETYKALLKTIDNDILTASEKQITDGLGGGSNVFIDSNGFLRANKYKVTNGLATQFLKADGSLDANTYLTSITGAQVITALGYTPVTDQRTLTINGVTYNLTANRSWTVAGTAAVWGNITGTLSNQTDLQAALNAKFNVPAGTISQYIRGDGSLAVLPTGGGGGGGSVSYYLNGSINQGTIGGVAYYEMNKVPIIGTGTDFSRNSNGYIASFLTDANDPSLLQIPAGNWNFETYLQASNGGGSPNFYIELYKYNGTNFTLIASNSGTPKLINDGANIEAYYSALAVPETTLTLTDRLAVRIYVNTANRTITMHTENGHLCEVITTFTKGLTALNGLTAQVQYLSTGTSGNDFNISSATNTHTFNLPTASAVNRGALSAADWIIFNAKQAQLNGTGFVKASGTTISYDNSTYLTTGDAASTYQLLTNLSTDLTASATKYPSVNAVIAGLATKQPLDADLTAIAGLAGTSGFLIKTAADTWSLDTNTYLTTTAAATTYLSITTAASTYQRLDKMVSNLLPSATEYPNSNAVIAALALKANAANPVFTGNMTISGAEPKLFFTDTDNNPDYTVFIDSGIFYIYDQTNGATRFSIGTTGNISAGVGKSITAGSFVKESGTAAQFLKADGSIDSSTYVTSASLANYLLITTAASTYQRLDKMVSNLLASDTEYPNSNAVLAKLALKADAANPVFTGDLSISGATPRLYFVDTDQNPDYTVFIDSGFFYIYDQTAGATRFSITPSGNAINSGTLTSTSFIKSGGTSAQFLKADGSVDSNTYVTGGPFLPLTGGTLTGSLNGTNISLSSGYSTTKSVASGEASPLHLNYSTSDGSAPVIRLGSGTQGFWDLQPSNNNQRLTFEWLDTVNVLSLFSTGNVGINTITDSGFRFDVNGTGRFSGNVVLGTTALSGGGAAQWLTANGSPYGGGFISSVSGVAKAYYYYDNGYNAAVVQGSTGVGVQLIANNVPALTIATTGASTFSNTLDVASNVTIGNGTLFVSAGSGQSYTARLSVAYSFPYIDTFLDSFAGASYESRLNFRTNAGGGAMSTKMTIYNNGNTLIGTTTDSGYKFDVNGTGRFNGDLRLSGNRSILLANNTVAAGGVVFYNSTTNTVKSGIGSYYNIGEEGALEFLAGGATTRMFLSSQGNLGIGANGFSEISFGSPILKLAGSRATIGLVSSGSLATIAMMANQNTATAIHINHDSSGNTEIYNYAAGSVVVNIKANGNFLINTTTDNGTKLNINAGSASGINVANAAAVLSISLGNSTNNTIVRMTSTSNTFWDLQANTDGSFHIDRGDVAAVTFATSRAATFSSSVTATSFFESSDSRLKTLIDESAQITGIENLQAKLYEKNGKIELGYFAQDAELIMPYAVTKNTDGFLNLSYREVHTAKIAKLEQRVAELEKQLNLN